MQELVRLAPFGRENPTPVLLVQHAFVDGLFPMGAEGRHTRVRLRQGNDTLFASIFGVSPKDFAYPVGCEVEAALEVSIFRGRSGPMVSAHLKAIRPAAVSYTHLDVYKRTAHGYKVGHIDAKLLCQRPKLAPHIPAMRQNIAAAFGLPVDAVSVKATTEEHLGFTGEGLGIAAHAVALIE